MSKCWYKTILAEGEQLNIQGDLFSTKPQCVEYVTENESGIVVRAHFASGSYTRHIQWSDIWSGAVKVSSAERKYEIEAKGEREREWQQFMR